MHINAEKYRPLVIMNKNHLKTTNITVTAAKDAEKMRLKLLFTSPHISRARAPIDWFWDAGFKSI